VETDACIDGIRAVLMQGGQPIAYLSKALGEKHRKLSIYRKMSPLPTKTRIPHTNGPQIIGIFEGAKPAL
jgi:hypothetical protein